jgi:peptidoglycan/LPS O-acetylase OafA/YrhL
MDFPLVDVLRGFCALSVVVYHVIEHFGWTDFPWSGPLSWFRFGWLGVDMFFVISGFVIALSAFTRIGRHGADRFRSKFITRRILRIAPLHYLTCILFVIFVQPFMLFAPGDWPQFVTHALFLHNWFPMHQGGINGVNWSLGDEVQFYVLMTMLAPMLMRAPAPLLLAGGLTIAWAWRAFAFFATDLSGPLGVFDRFWLSTQLPGMLDEFVFGILLARLVLNRQARDFVLGTVHRFWVLPVVSVALLWFMVTTLWNNGTYWNSPAMVILFRSCIGLAFAAVILTCCGISTPTLVRLTTPLRYLGTISYGIYLWHLMVILSLHKLPWLPAQRALPTVVLATLGLATLSWHFLERPLMEGARTSRPIKSRARENGLLTSGNTINLGSS